MTTSQRWLAGLILISAGACHEPPLATPVPQLTSSVGPGASSAGVGAHFVAGESLGWSVYWRGFRVGDFDVSVSQGEPRHVQGNLRQNRMARNLHRARVDLETTIGRDGFPVTANEDTRIAGSRRFTALTFQGQRVEWKRASRRGENSAPIRIHSLLSALGALRQRVSPRRLFVATGASVYELNLSVATREELDGESVLRIDAEAREVGHKNVEALISIWVTDNKRRAPARVDVDVGGTRLIAKRRR